MKTRLLTLFSVLLFLLSFIAGMMWEISADLRGTRFDLGFTVTGVEVSSHLTFYEIPKDHWDCKKYECRYRPFRHNSAGAVSSPMWIVSVVLAPWPIWWLRRHERLRFLGIIDLP